MATTRLPTPSINIEKLKEKVPGIEMFTHAKVKEFVKDYLILTGIGDGLYLLLNKVWSTPLPEALGGAVAGWYLAEALRVPKNEPAKRAAFLLSSATVFGTVVYVAYKYKREYFKKALTRLKNALKKMSVKEVAMFFTPHVEEELKAEAEVKPLEAAPEEYVPIEIVEEYKPEEKQELKPQEQPKTEQTEEKKENEERTGGLIL